MQKILGSVRRTVQQYEMLPAGRRVAVGLSGGKDSVALLCSLARLQKIYDDRFSLVAVTLDPRFGGVGTDYSVLGALCD